MKGFSKDMGICLRAAPAKDKPGSMTHAYFPALMNCCGTLEYLAGLFTGRAGLPSVGHDDWQQYGRFLPQPAYSPDVLRVLYKAFRNPVAHRGIASGVWVDRHHQHLYRRVTWTISADSKHPAIDIRDTPGQLRNDPPWECTYTHRAHIHLGRLWRDIRDSALAAGGYRDELATDNTLVSKFEACMRRLYPR